MNHSKQSFPLLVLAMLLAGCAVQQGPGRSMHIGIDNAALFGRTIDEFLLPDGSAATVRQLEQRFSVKLQAWSRVVDIDKATSLRFRSAQEVDGYALIVLDKSERQCRHKIQLLAVKGAEVRAWDFGNCQSPPLAVPDGSGASFDVAQGARMTRYRFSQGRLLYGDMIARAPAPMPLPLPASAGIPVASGTAPAAVRTAKAPVPARKPAAPAPARAARRAATLPAGELEFEQKEQAPRTMYLNR